jgi:hypothetical protein
MTDITSGIIVGFPNAKTIRMLSRSTFALLGLSMLMTLSCTKEPDFTGENLVGRWNVTQVTGQQFNDGVPGIVLTDENPTGFIRFESNGSGEQNYTFNLLGSPIPNTGAFMWTANAIEIRIKQVSSPDMIWRRDIDEANKQIATYTITVSPSMTIEYTLTLEK